MKQAGLKPHLGIFFIAAVLFPSIILSVIAIRSLSREEAFIEKRMHDTLLAEVTHVSSVVAAELNTIEKELNSNTAHLNRDNPEDFLKAWEKQNNLVEVPFLVSGTGEIIYPSYETNPSAAEKTFLDWNRQFFRGEVKIPVYENIAVAYKDEIVKDDNRNYYSDKSERRKSPEVNYSLSQESANIVGEQYQSQQAINSWEQNLPIRQKIYDQAKQTGKSIVMRQVQIEGKSEKDAVLPQKESMFVSEPLSFNQILSKSNSGIIPRSINENLKLIFWRKTEGGRVVGCVINQAALKDRIVGLLPQIYSSARIITVLDENGKPLILPKGVGSRNWQRPFVAKEISSILPHWEAVAYLANPGMVKIEAGAVTFIMWALIMILFISISTGGFLVLKSLRSEMALARQKTTFVANVSHELKTPLTSIKMFAEMLKERRVADEAKKEKYLDLMVSETDRLARLINNVLDFSRMEQGRKQYVLKKENIIVLCRELIEGQRLRLENNGFVVNFITDSNEVMAEIDAEAIKQALINLLSNAEKYSDGGKSIDLEITHDASRVYIQVKDKGKGVPAADVQKIFKEFYRCDDSLTARVKGTGLGLTIASRIARDHSGDIVYKAREGGGSVFTLILPVKAGS
ncbi:MAG: HAMP domain-containing sensor histidine kinase [Candidatus Omnitrophica bacterium]|nr:HAMP domain-containing sensor histidine kinase [Candidatus Omnitrophota bacterium]